MFPLPFQNFLNSTKLSIFTMFNQSEVTLELEEDQFLTIPDRVFTHIFSYISVSSRKQCALVCQKFYDLLCFMERDQFPLDLNCQQVVKDTEIITGFSFIMLHFRCVRMIFMTQLLVQIASLMILL